MMVHVSTENVQSNEDLIIVDVQTDQFGFETSILLTDFNGQTALDVSAFTDNTLSSFNVCVPNGRFIHLLFLTLMEMVFVVIMDLGIILLLVVVKLWHLEAVLPNLRQFR